MPVDMAERMMHSFKLSQAQVTSSRNEEESSCASCFKGLKGGGGGTGVARETRKHRRRTFDTCEHKTPNYFSATPLPDSIYICDTITGLGTVTTLTITNTPSPLNTIPSAVVALSVQFRLEDHQPSGSVPTLLLNTMYLARNLHFLTGQSVITFLPPFPSRSPGACPRLQVNHS